MVGSSCILKFEVAVLEDGVVLEKPKAKKKLNKSVKDMRIQSCINALTKLAEKEDTDILKNALDYYFLEKNNLSPKFAFVVMWRLRKNDIDHYPSFFKVSLRRKKHKDDLEEMEESWVHLIWPCPYSESKRDGREIWARAITVKNIISRRTTCLSQRTWALPRTVASGKSPLC